MQQKYEQLKEDHFLLQKQSEQRQQAKKSSERALEQTVLKFAETQQMQNKTQEMLDERLVKQKLQN